MVTTTITKTGNEHGRYANEVDRYFKDAPYLLDPNKEWRILFCGLTGDGKTLNAVGLLLTDWLFRGRRVFSNISIEKTVALNGTEKTYKSETLDPDMLYEASEDNLEKYGLLNAAIFVDEANYYCDSRRSISSQNIYIADVAQQTRKMEMSLIFTLMFAEWTDPRVRQLTDLCIRCRDQERTEWGRENGLGEGELFHIQVEDWSGKLTGQSYYYTGAPAHEWTVQGKNIWGSYRTKNIIDSHEARNSYRNNFDAHGVKIGKNTFAEKIKGLYGEVEPVIAALGEKGVTRISDTELFKFFPSATELRDRIELGYVFKAMGIVKKQRGNTGIYIIPPKLVYPFEEYSKQ